MQGYIIINKLNNGYYAATGYSNYGFLIISTTYDKNYKKAYGRVYSKLKTYYKYD